MIEFETKQKASPNARIGKLTVDGIELETPVYLPTLMRKSDPEKVVEAANYLKKQGNNLDNIGGFITEVHNVDILGDKNSSTQKDLDGNDTIDSLHDLDNLLIIDPNTDRMFYSYYRDEFLDIKEDLPDGAVNILLEMEKEKEDREINRPRKAYKQLKQNIQDSRSTFSLSFLKLQNQNDCNLFLPPYVPIHRKSMRSGNNERSDLEENITLFKISRQLSERLYDKPLVPVLPVKTDIIKAYDDTDGSNNEPPREWKEIFEQYKELDPDFLFLKVTNLDLEPGKLEKRNLEGVFYFFKLLREKLDIPVFFLGMDEFAYILMSQGLDGYTHPIYDQPYRTSPAIDEDDRPDDINYNRKFLVPRKWKLEKFDQLDNLGCRCPFCLPYEDEDPADIGLGDQDDLRRKHWIWLRDEELDELKEAIRKDQVRPGLESICNDSEWKKNLSIFI